MWYSWTVGTSEQSPTLRQGLRSEMMEPLTGYVSQDYSQVSKRVVHEPGTLKDLAGLYTSTAWFWKCGRFLVLHLPASFCPRKMVPTKSWFLLQPLGTRLVRVSSVPSSV